MYEYECIECGQGFEAIRRTADMDKVIECPGCGKRSQHIRQEVPDCHFQFADGLPSYRDDYGGAI